MAGQLALQLAHAGCGGSRDDDFDIRQARLQGTDELGAKIDFAHADGMHPESLAVGDGLLKFRVKTAKTLAEAALPIAPATHPQEIMRAGENEKDRK